MKYTNKYDLPNILVQWLKFDEYDYEPGVFSATSIMRPIKSTVLITRHADELEIDVSDRIASRYGTALHESFEKIPLEHCNQEKRLYAELDGFKVSGKPDMLRLLPDQDKFILMDIKSTSVWTYIYGSRDIDHILQLSIYRWLAKENGYSLVDEGEIIYLFTDWSKSKAKKDENYPQLRCVVKTIKLMPYEEIVGYMRDRLMAIGLLLDDDTLGLPRCQRDELWQKDDQWAVMRKNRKTAVKVYDTKDEAMNRVCEEGEGTHFIEHRPGKIYRCDYCDARAWCEQYDEHVANNLLPE